MDLQTVKNRYEIIGNAPRLNHALETALRVAPTDMSVLIHGESGVGKEVFSKIIHQNSLRKHGPFIAVNCGAIPEGTIDSELFGHEKGAFTGATDARKGYFETVHGGTLFLDEIGELPLGTQARLLRVLESGEYIRVGSSKIQKTNVRVVAATNKNLLGLSQKNKFREDLYYRLATVPIHIPKLNERKEDIYLIFKKFLNDFADKYKTGHIELNEDAIQLITQYSWPGNIRQLRNFTEQVCVLEQPGELGAEELEKYLPPVLSHLPGGPVANQSGSNTDFSERDILYRILFDLKKDMNELKKIVYKIIENSESPAQFIRENREVINQVFSDAMETEEAQSFSIPRGLPEKIEVHNRDLERDTTSSPTRHSHSSHTIEIEETKTLQEQEIEMIVKALDRNKGKRKKAAQELGISERTLYRKIKQYELES